ncbi:P-loop NTPase fold protein [Marivirga sp.]|uniref:P-loop NTPase fold protein n=1 Tax=Marivirga sp. TaxID=2018662 RepID=UPI002D7F252F|nr:P-loop NTPase fold protein [Marivirga sp.]HET8860736.1 P-loop NTPase fold protein [Marivirga sp.]
MEISTEEISKSFLEHLKMSENNQILFSGRFGIGKSYFLKEFFAENSEKYTVITISPVNYSVASNKDIFEYIKYDILFELLKKGVVDKENDLKNTENAFAIIQSLNIKAFGSFLKMIPQIGKDLSNIFEGLTELKDHLEAFKNDLDQEEKIKDYLKSYTEEIGSIYEENFITSLINELLSKLKTEYKETVLIIEDLDRLDPEHIFRILNIFSVHTDFQSGRFKFNFDKVILVCDIKNIQNIYKHRYGSDVDFEGYMDKFYSHSIFHFKNEENLRNEIRTIITNSVHPNEQNFYKTHVDYTSEILTAMCMHGELTPRMLEKHLNFNYKSSNQKINTMIDHLSYTEGRKLNSFLVVEYLTKIYGGLGNLKSKINILRKYKVKSKFGIYHHLIGDTVYLIDYSKNNLNSDRGNEYEIDVGINSGNYKIVYKGNDRIISSSSSDAQLLSITDLKTEQEIERKDYPQFFYELFYKLLEKVESEKLFDFD